MPRVAFKMDIYTMHSPELRRVQPKVDGNRDVLNFRVYRRGWYTVVPERRPELKFGTGKILQYTKVGQIFV